MTQKLQSLFLLSIPLFIAHGLEEYFNDFYHIDPSIQLIFGRLGFSLASTFLVFQIVLWLLLILGFILLRKNILSKTISIFMAGLLVFELWHIYKAIMIGGYYPGLYTALLFPTVGYFYWRELIKNYKLSNKSI